MYIIEKNNIIKIYPENQLEIEYFKTIEEKIYSLVKEDKEEKIIVMDLSNIDYMNSEILSFFSKLFINIKNRGYKMRVCGLNEKLKTVFQITFLDKIIPVMEEI